MKKIKIISLCILGAIIVSCGTSSNVVSGKLISKRKVNKGFHINTSHNLKGHEQNENTAKRAEFIQYTEEAEVSSQSFDAVSNTVVEKQMSDALESNDVLAQENVVSIPKGSKNFSENKVSSLVELKKDNKNSKAEKQVIKKAVKAIKKESKKSDDMLILLYILCIFIPPVAVGLATDWDITTVVINVLWCLLCGLPGIIHAFIVVSREN
ncbi:MAG: YqaE/Pmp3 family membrane protein [Flavobacteriia bacterium]|jgi:uncharacterized membrane protein YqaE (UPF0057 family)